MNAYRDRIAASAPANIIAGDYADRLAGLERLLALSAGLSVYDVGCHVGVILEAFGRAGAAPLAGCDIHHASLKEARARLPDADIREHDLVLGSPDFSADIVLYLGVHHHLAEQVGFERATETALAIAGKARQMVALRSPPVVLEPLAQRMMSSGFVELYTDDSNPKVSPLRVFRSPGL